MSPVMMTHFEGSPPWKFASFAWPVNWLKRRFGFAALKPDCPPSPQTSMFQTVPDPVVDQVPLSCVPPMMFFGSCGFTEKLWNCRVESPLLRLKSCVGTRDSSCWHVARSAAFSPRSAHWAETSAKSPLVRTMPPSEPKNVMLLPGTDAIAWESGCMPFGVVSDEASRVTSLKFAPASVE